MPSLPSSLWVGWIFSIKVCPLKRVPIAICCGPSFFFCMQIGRFLMNDPLKNKIFKLVVTLGKDVLG